ncbi:MAG: hypothetical protein ACFFCL_09360, partial [Promethearchaeota archaeon]
MVRRKKEIKRIFFVVLFVITVFLSNVQILSNINVFQDERTNNETVLDELPLSSNLDLNDIITGSGVNQDVRIYVNNESENLLNNENYFEIPSLPTEDMYLSYGNFNFTFQNNFTTDYIIEDDNALYANDFISFDFDTGASSININNGTIISGGYSQLVDGNENSNIYLNAENGLLNFTVSADFTDTTFTSGVIIGNVKFNRTRILALISSLMFGIYSDANLTIRIRDYSQPTWKEVISNLPINSSLNKQEVNDHFINENLNFIDLTSICYIEFSFERFDKNQFYTRLYEYDLQATYAFDLPITSQEYVALEFDLKGESSAVNGFYAWIRTLDLVEAATSQLNITLYRANRTVVRTDANLRNVNLGPNYNEMIDSKLVSYTGDNLSYFDFNIGNTGNLNLDNYFIVIKSDNSKMVYSLVTLPWYTYGDSGETEHQLKTTLDDGSKWRNARKVIETTNQPYTSGQLDASSFKLDVTRGYMPSDFIVDSVNTLRIQEITIENLVIKSFPYNESSYLTWGLGQWNNPFPNPIEDDAFNNFQVDLTWNKSIIKGFQFTVNYSVNAYWVESASATYSATYNKDPEWLLTYNLQKGDPNFNNWDFLEFWYVYPNFLTAHNLTDPDNTQILGQTGGQTALSEDPTKNKVVVKKILAIPDGFYNLNLTSFNFIRKMDSYINYNDILWESNGFMNGDNISVSVKIQDHYNRAPISGDANATLFYPDGTRFTSLPQDLVGEIEGSSLTYDFDNQTILDVTNALTIFGKYHLGFFWFNGSA